MNRLNRLFLSILLVASVLAAGCSSTQPASRPPEVAGPTAAGPSTADPSVVAVFNRKALSIDEFEHQYARSVGGRTAAADDSLTAYRDFLNRYINFRLKVLAAEDAGLGQDAQLQAEMAAYRTAMARPYLLDGAIYEPFMHELYDRWRTMTDASHILIQVGEQAAPEDTLAAYNRMAALVDSLAHGADFGALAARYSEDPSARGAAGAPGAQGRLGYFTAGQMVPEFEQAAFDTPVGGISPIFRTRFGYHVLKVHDKQPTVPNIRVGHIMMVPRQKTPEAIAEVRAQMQDLHARLLAGEDFAALAAQYSVHMETKDQGGLLGELKYSVPMPSAPAFKEAAFAIEEVGGYSDVVETPYGFHIIKLYDRQQISTFEEAYDDLKRAAARLPQTRAALHRFAVEARTRHGFSVDSAQVRSTFAGVPDDSIAIVLLHRKLPESALSTPFATIGDSTYTYADLIDFAADGIEASQSGAEARVFRLIERFLDEKSIDYEAATLEERDAEFARIMGDFRDGLLLFKLMEDSVWNAAARDSAALRAFYAPRAASYRFPDRARLTAFYGPKEALEALAARLDAGTAAAALQAEINADSSGTVRIDTAYVSGRTGSPFDRALNLAEGQHTDVFPYLQDFALLVRDGEEPARQKTFEEARAEVITDYQQHLEERLIESLRARYGVQVFPDRLAGAFADEPASTSSAEAAGQAAPASTGPQPAVQAPEAKTSVQ